MHTHKAVNTAQTIILRDLVDALLFEDIAGIVSNSEITKEHGQTILIYKNGDQQIKIPVYFSALNMFRYESSKPITIDGKSSSKQLTAPEFWRMIVNMNRDLSHEWEVARVEEGLNTAITQLAKQLSELDLATHPFVMSEQFASLKDRPFHPLAKEKRGLSETDYQVYQAELNQSFPLMVAAVKKTHMIHGDEADYDELESLTAPIKDQATDLLNNKGLSIDDYVLFPVHPWQYQHILPNIFAKEIAEKLVVLLPLKFGDYLSSSSMRSLIDVASPYNHVKVPFAMQSLGALRLTPTRYMKNGEQAERLLRQLINKDEVLAKYVTVCDETAWWSYMGQDNDIFKDQLGHLTVQLRKYPEVLAQNDEQQLVSMAALAANDCTLYQMICGKDNLSQNDIMTLFEDIAQVFLKVTLSFMQYGALPELHGQNILLSFEEGRVQKCVLRDHDTVRIYKPWLTAHQLSLPQYVVREDTPNTLINEDLETFFAYFQTLAVSVNLYAIIDALQDLFGVSEHDLMSLLKRILKNEVATISWVTVDQLAVRHILFEKQTWPFKQILLPLLYQRDSGGGSMPSGLTTVPNPMVTYD
ncbi:staphyloferrin B biosynthesis protein SbnC [Staphylococcus argenteus]|uniref:staphyloferrin B biosynthesis protein SbnC n=1 Tax=Staphylococcus argenteus TaxID=985002 RepID=UPI000500FAE6|nr:staphyloferrin B biosynthesis protein SbnC [Staphylococcus argenteus]MBE2133286.1 staphyloferrin B biosynthesis protein SbnC [Staphylococcus argenteus]MBE2147377.1 staphyloferrin B biosynthesis protein SbnC [Staphylococcus argenteus]MBE2160903.1 staphyloferrin B biosynthesis protein SbnC [Staphylococcus argenteus]MCG9796987.1 staphyloferrin B biosynthesis protein SbnC [Staphylococcus argenteus]MCG9799475.1 staphyloferrin B biosynthesis protein SbnC [Staphylococcus argenteus]